MICEIHRHVAGMMLRARGQEPEMIRSAARNGAVFAIDALAGADKLANALTPHLITFRNLLEVAEAAGWDGHPSTRAILDRAREAHAALTGFSNEGKAS